MTARISSMTARGHCWLPKMGIHMTRELVSVGGVKPVRSRRCHSRPPCRPLRRLALSSNQVFENSLLIYAADTGVIRLVRSM